MHFNIFDHASPQLVDWLRGTTQTTEVFADTRLIEEGQRCKGMFIVENGSLQVRTSQETGVSLEMAELGPGSLVGDMSWLESRPAVADVIALRGSRIVHIAADVLDRLNQGLDPIAPLLHQAIGTKLSLQIQSQNAWIHRFAASPQEPLRKVLVLFADLNEQDIEWLRQIGQLQRLKPGDVLLQQGQAVPSLYLLLAGEARIQIKSEGRLHVVGSSRRGELLGEMTLLNPKGTSASAQVDAPDGMEVLRIDKGELLAGLACDVGRATRFWRALARMLSQRSRDQLLERGLAATSRRAEQERNDDEIDLKQLSTISIAGNRFDWLCRQFQDQVG